MSDILANSSVGKINAIGNGTYGDTVKDSMTSNSRGAVIGGVVGVVLAMHFQKNVIAAGVVGLLLGKVFLKLK
jgi:hypothetical protein